MHSRRATLQSSAIPPRWARRVRRLTQQTLDFTPVLVRGAYSGATLIAAARSLGGLFTPLGEALYWTTSCIDLDAANPSVALTPDLLQGKTWASDFIGAGVLELEGMRVLVCRADIQVTPVYLDRATILAAPTLEVGLRIADRLRGEIERLHKKDVHVFGGSGSRCVLPNVSETDLVLPTALREQLLGYVDAFWRGAEIARRLRIAQGRGILLVGAPGTGKTMVVRHLLARFHEARRYVYATDRSSRSGEQSFSVMVNEVAGGNTPAIVVIEDVDRIFASGAVSPEYFLNVLDGLFQPAAPVLWIATSNDPTGLEDNLLDRPGRFDRVFVFPLPTAREREALLVRYSLVPVGHDVIVDAAHRSEGLSGAHLKEACYAAALESDLRNADYQQALFREIDRVLDQHARSQLYWADVRKQRNVGFVDGRRERVASRSPTDWRS